MPAYQFEAVDAQGQPLRGVVEADSPKAVRAQLRGNGYVPIAVDPVATAQTEAQGPWWQRSLWQGKAFNRDALAVWTRQLASLVAAGLTIERALSALADEAPTPAQQALLAALRSEVHAGASFASALQQHPREFSAVYVSVVSAGEAGGKLGDVLTSLADELEQRQQLQHKLMGAAIYPAIVCVFAIFIVLFLMTYVVPQVAHVFAGSKKTLPLLTVAMLAISAFVRQWGWVLALLVVGAAFAWRQLLRSDEWALRHDAFWLRAPVVGRFVRGYNATRFASTLAMLTGAGVPILKALQSAADTMPNRALRADVLQAQVLVREGAPLAQALAQNRRLPGLLPMFARLGEQTGTLPTMLQRAAAQLSQEVQRRALALANAAEPLLIIGMGLLVLLIVLAVLLPIIELNQWVK